MIYCSECAGTQFSELLKIIISYNLQDKKDEPYKTVNGLLNLFISDTLAPLGLWLHTISEFPAIGHMFKFALIQGVLTYTHMICSLHQGTLQI